ncbi:hypothetical protein [Pedobacter antarcticus]|uniref:hypothetical protein n=1 Tax=Pedobacter antarcticus TaxID=34086 RepID=UPI00088FC737|nr:hypothetical protein [Pedobacter antarcticus]SDM84121.1 hypothetical protein SAMN04488084_11557 [Pedobacter antarcticus]
MIDPHKEYFTGFDYAPDMLSKFIAAGDIFTIMLKDGNIVHYTPENKELFKKWLQDHNVTNIR